MRFDRYSPFAARLRRGSGLSGALGAVLGSEPLVEDDSLFLVTRTLVLDHAAAVAVEQLTAANLPSILLKGAVIATWLYDEEEPRYYSDVDLLVSPDDFARAVMVLGECGYTHRLEGAAPCEFGPNAKEMVGPGGVCIDLHHRLLGVSGPADDCWNVLFQRTVPFCLESGTEAQVLDVPARTMHLALHAAQNGPADAKALADLVRGLERVTPDVWKQASELADELGAVAAFGAGLRLVPAGRLLADELALTQSL